MKDKILEMLDNALLEVIKDAKKAGVETHNRNINIKLNPRLRTSYGRARTFYRNNEPAYHEIEISKKILDDEVEFIDTVMHEYLHTCHPRDGHRGGFVVDGVKVNEAFPGKYHVGTYIETVYSKESLNKTKDYKYMVFCPKCGKYHKKYKIRTKAVKDPESFACPECGSALDSKMLEDDE